MTRLLNRQLKTLSLFALLVLVCSIPAYYYVVDSIWLEELDEHNELIKERVAQKFKTTHLSDTKLEEVVELWSLFQPGTRLEPQKDNLCTPDSTYEVERENEFEGEMDRFRGLASCIRIRDKNYLLTVETNVEEAGETIALIGLVTFFFFGIMLTGFVLLNRRISARIWGPFEDTLAKLKSFKLSDENKLQFENTDILEFSELNAELDRLIANNIDHYQKQKRFVENASHELQTPLAVLRSKLELLLQSEELTEKQSQLIQAISLPLSRMTRLNKNLLILAKIENQQYRDKEALSMRALVQENLLLLEDYSEANRLKIEFTADQDFSISANKFLLETLLNNLITNAFKFSQPGDTIKITLGEQRLSVSNPGKEILNREQLFQRFSNPSKDQGNSGLGLAIVQEICLAHQWTISYNFTEQRHLFVVDF